MAAGAGGVIIGINLAAYEDAAAWLKENPTGSTRDYKEVRASEQYRFGRMVYFLGTPGREIACMRRR